MLKVTMSECIYDLGLLQGLCLTQLSRRTGLFTEAELFPGVKYSNL